MIRVETAIVGAGFAGISAALALRRAGHESFVILERASAIGGTWRDNTYPGVACDVPSHLYGLSTHPWPDWSATFASGAEIRDYLERIVAEEDLSSRVRLDTPLTEAHWDGDGWILRASDEIIHATHLVVACGRLTEPKLPEIPGLDAFPGPVFHSARWRHDVELDSARIAVVGTGASAVQLVPELHRRGAEVTLFQRTPAWIVPRGNREHSPAERRLWRESDDELARLREELYAEGEQRYASRAGDREAAQQAASVALAHLETQVPDPVLREALTPDYAFGCKRVLLSDDFYPAIASGDVRLEPSALASVEDGELVAASGARYAADALVLATGFESTRQPYARLITGEHGLTLDGHWSHGFTSVGSTLVHGFPNLFVLNGPNASLGHNSAVLIMEAQAEFAASLIGSGTVRVSAEAEREYTREIDERAAETPWITGGCRNWYVDERSGRLTLLWPGTVDAFRERLARVRRELGAPAPIPEPSPTGAHPPSDAAAVDGPASPASSAQTSEDPAPTAARSAYAEAAAPAAGPAYSAAPSRARTRPAPAAASAAEDPAPAEAPAAEASAAENPAGPASPPAPAAAARATPTPVPVPAEPVASLHFHTEGAS